VASATINLFALPALPAFESPNADNPVTTVDGDRSGAGASEVALRKAPNSRGRRCGAASGYNCG
jgi:hypothetical protein